MPLRNRVAPTGEIFSAPVRGTFMGNRGGAIHNENREIVRQYASRRWIACVLEFKGRRRNVMSPGRYTELFFLDEAVALAAGHRPCAECRRRRYNDFKEAWLGAEKVRAGNPRNGEFLSADAMDLDIHRTRIDRGRNKVTCEAPLRSLPDGVFIRKAGVNYLVLGDALLRWSPAGYVEKQSRGKDATVTVLTPAAIVECIRHGYTPEIHESAFAL